MTADDDLRRRALKAIDNLEPVGGMSDAEYAAWSAGVAAARAAFAARSEPHISAGKVEQRPGLDLTGYGQEPRAWIDRPFTEAERAAMDAATPPAEGHDHGSVERVARDAIGLFIEYRDKHGRDEVAALDAAVQEVIEGSALAATPAAEGLDVERDAERIRDPKAWWAGYSAGYIARGKEYAAIAPEQPE